MSGIHEFMAREHGKCDEHFATAEQDVSKSNWEDANTNFSQFVDSLERHLAMEEQVLFPYLEQIMGSSGGPVAVMKMEHSQMRDLIQTLTENLKQQDKDGFLGVAETLLVLMQQHNMKEEQILYPMADQMLSDKQDKVIGEMEKM